MISPNDPEYRGQGAGFPAGAAIFAFAMMALFWLATTLDAARIECITASTIASAANCTGAGAPWACCTGAGAGATCLDLSATYIEVRGGNLSASDIEVYSSADAVTDPVTRTEGVDITCAGWDTSGEAEVWTRCDENAPWLLMDNTAAVSTAEHWPRDLESHCQVALKITNSGAGGDVCLFLAVTTERGLGPDASVQDGSTKGRWAKATP